MFDGEPDDQNGTEVNECNGEKELDTVGVDPPQTFPGALASRCEKTHRHGKKPPCEKENAVPCARQWCAEIPHEVAICHVNTLLPRDE